MPNARDAKEWATAGGLRGIGDSLYTPSGGRSRWTSAAAAKDCVELTQHAQAAGADNCFLQTPPMEVSGGEGVLRFFQYVADRTDIALGMFNSPSSGYVLTPEEVALIATEVPAVCATKEGTLEYWRSKAAHVLAPDLVIWECDTIVYRVGRLQQGIVGPAQLGTSWYLQETPDRPILTQYWTLMWDGRIAEAMDHARATGLDRITEEIAHWYIRHPSRPDYFSHWVSRSGTRRR